MSQFSQNDTSFNKKQFKVYDLSKDSKTSQNIANIALLSSNIHASLCRSLQLPKEFDNKVFSEYLSQQTLQYTQKLLEQCKEMLRKFVDRDITFDSVQGCRVDETKLQLIKKENRIKQLQNMLIGNENKTKIFHKKLVLGTKQLQKQLQNKDGKIKQLNQIILKKDEQLSELVELYGEKNSKISKLSQENIHLFQKMNELQQQLETQKQCSSILEHKLSRYYQTKIQTASLHVPYQPIQSNHFKIEKSNQIQPISHNKESQFQIGTQTDQTDIEDTISLMSNLTDMTESKEGKYLKSIDKLTTELSDAYQKINDLMNLNQSRIVKRKGPGYKPKTSSSYFGKIFK